MGGEQQQGGRQVGGEERQLHLLYSVASQRATTRHCEAQIAPPLSASSDLASSRSVSVLLSRLETD